MHKGEELGKWSEDAWCDPRTSDIAGDMLELQRLEKLPRTARLESLKEILNKNRRSGSMPQGLSDLVEKYDDVFRSF